MCLFLSSNYGKNQINPLKCLWEVFPRRPLSRSLLLKDLEKSTGSWQVATAAGFSQDFRGTHGVRSDKSFVYFPYPETHCPLTPRTFHVTIAGNKGSVGFNKRDWLYGKKRGQNKIGQQQTAFFSKNLSLTPP